MAADGLVNDFNTDPQPYSIKDLVQNVMGSGGAKASRIAGSTHYVTALEIAKLAYPSGSGAKNVYAANGFASADATVAGFIDNKPELAGPVLLVQSGTVPAEVEEYVMAARMANTGLAGKFKALGGKAVIYDVTVDMFKTVLK